LYRGYLRRFGEGDTAMETKMANWRTDAENIYSSPPRIDEMAPQYIKSQKS